MSGSLEIDVSFVNFKANNNTYGLNVLPLVSIIVLLYSVFNFIPYLYSILEH